MENFAEFTVLCFTSARVLASKIDSLADPSCYNGERCHQDWRNQGVFSCLQFETRCSAKHVPLSSSSESQSLRGFRQEFFDRLSPLTVNEAGVGSENFGTPNSLIPEILARERINCRD